MNLPSGWTTPTGGGLHLKTLMAVDGLGRTTKLTDPLGNITYTVYKVPTSTNSNWEVRSYPGWNGTTGSPTGPTQDSREDRPGSYMESLTMSAVPHLASAPAAPGLAQTSGGTPAATTSYLKVPYPVNRRETPPSPHTRPAPPPH